MREGLFHLFFIIIMRIFILLSLESDLIPKDHIRAGGHLSTTPKWIEEFCLVSSHGQRPAAQQIGYILQLLHTFPSTASVKLESCKYRYQFLSC